MLIYGREKRLHLILPLSALPCRSSSLISAAVVLNSSVLPEMAVPLVNKATELESSVPPEVSIVPKEVDPLQLPEEISEATGDQLNGVAATQVVREQTKSAVEEDPVVLQATTANPTVATAKLSMTDDLTLAEASGSGETIPEDKGATTERLDKSLESAVTGKPPSEAEERYDETFTEVKIVAEEVPVDPKHSQTAKDSNVKCEAGLTNSASESAEEGLKDVSMATTPQEAAKVSDFVNVDVATKILIEKEPVTIPSKTIQSKLSSNCAEPSLSTRPLSGWLSFIQSLTQSCKRLFHEYKVLLHN